MHQPQLEPIQRVQDIMMGILRNISPLATRENAIPLHLPQPQPPEREIYLPLPKALSQLRRCNIFLLFLRDKDGMWAYG